MSEQRQVTVESSLQHITLSRIVGEGRRIRGIVFDPWGQPLGGARVGLGKHETRTDAGGDYAIVVGPDEEVGGLNLTDPLRDQIELDSMDFLDIVMELRKRYGVQVPEDDYKELATLQGCSDYLAPLLADHELVKSA